jgi:hypothetical protein
MFELCSELAFIGFQSYSRRKGNHVFHSVKKNIEIVLYTTGMRVDAQNPP